MNTEIIIGIFTAIVSFITLFIALSLPIREFLRNSLYKKIRKFYEIYRLLSPSFGQNYKNISRDLQSQWIAFYGFSENFINFSDEFKKFDPFSKEIEEIVKELSIFKLLNLNSFWRVLLKKLKKIANIILDFDYLYRHWDKPILFYNECLMYESTDEIDIKETSISFCPSYDLFQLLGIKQQMTFEAKKNKISKEELLSLKHNNKKMKKEINSDYFNFNFEFKFTNRKKEILSDDHLKFSLFFENKQIKKIEVADSLILAMGKTEKEELKKCISFLKKIFKIKEIVKLISFECIDTLEQERIVEYLKDIDKEN